VTVCDVLGDDGKWRNLAKRQLSDIVPPAQLSDWLKGRRLDAVIHLGAISETRPPTAMLVIEDQFPAVDAIARLVHRHCDAVHLRLLGIDLWRRRAGVSRRPIRRGAEGAAADEFYGWSKHLFDMAVAERLARAEKLPPQWAGLKFFNVFGPNEYHKGTMMSVLARRSTTSGMAGRCNCSGRIATASPMATSGATSSIRRL